jgi:signal transduction histidine kinase
LLVAGLAFKPEWSIPSALFPAMALELSVYLILPPARWPAVAGIATVIDLAVMTPVIWLASGHFPPLWYVMALTGTTTIDSVVMVLMFRACRFALRDQEPIVLIAPLLVLALALGSLPGVLLSTYLHAVYSHQPLEPLDVAIRCLSSTLTAVSLCPVALGLLRGFGEPIRAQAGAKEHAYIACTFLLLGLLYFVLPWHLDRFLELLFLAGPMLWISLRCSQRTVAVACAAATIGVGIACARGIGAFPALASAGAWRDEILSAQLFLLIMCGETVLINRIVLKERALLRDSKQKEAILAAYCAALDAAVDRTRRDAARDLHDGVSQIMAGQSMILSALRRRVAEPQLCEMVDQAIAASKEAQATVRSTIEDLSPPEIDRATAPEVLAWLTAFFAQRYGFIVNAHVSGDPAAAALDSGLIYKTLRELIFNAYKHSQTDTVYVSLESGPVGICIVVSDDGVGFEPASTPPDGRTRFGLAHLTERITVAGGRLDIRSAAGHGCSITVNLPLSHRAQARIEKIAQPVPEDIERQHRQHDGGTGKHGEPPASGQQLIAAFREHSAPAGYRGRDAQAQERQRGLREYHAGDIE